MSGVDLFRSRCNVSRETLLGLETLEALLRKWNPAINLVSPQTLDQIWDRHFLDSAQLFDLVAPAPDLWVDLGSGGGFPGLVVGILAREKSPGMTLVMVESDKRKAVFLQTAVRELGLKAQVHPCRIEALPPLQAPILSARALAPLEKLLEFAQLHLAVGGAALFPKGHRWREEVALARQKWSFEFEPKPSTSDPDSVVLKVTRLQHV